MNIDWTHKKITITDVRKVFKFYVLSIDDKIIKSPLFVDHNIFDARLKSYYLKNGDEYFDIKRTDILNVKWNMVINKGYFVKYDKNQNLEKIEKDPEKYYISFLEIDGPLGTHISN